MVGGAANHATELSLDYVVGTTPAFSVFWVTLAAAAALVLAGLAGWAVGRGADAGARAKLERELESTYRRLRDCEARLPRAATPVAEVPTVVAPATDELPTVVGPAAGEEQTVVAPTGGELPTAVTPAAGETRDDGPADDDASPAGRDATT